MLSCPAHVVNNFGNLLVFETEKLKRLKKLKKYIHVPGMWRMWRMRERSSGTCVHGMYTRYVHRLISEQANKTGRFRTRIVR